MARFLCPKTPLLAAVTVLPLLPCVSLAQDAMPAMSPEVMVEAAVAASEAQAGGLGAPVETFDPIARARLIADELPRLWVGSYQPFAASGQISSVELSIEMATPMGQMVDLRGRMTIDGVETPVQGNLNAKSDQLDLLLLGDDSFGGGLKPGGDFQGLQGLVLSGWDANRLTEPGGRLQLMPAPSATGEIGDSVPVRGLW